VTTTTSRARLRARLGAPARPDRRKAPGSQAELGIQKGGADSFKMAIVHSSAAWPEGLAQMNGKVTYSDDSPTWAVISAPTWD
jgi:hypothetical protein